MAAALRLLQYMPFAELPRESKNGFVFYDGTAHNYYLWEYKLDLTVQAIVVRPDQPEKEHIAYTSLMVGLTESLSGKALQIASEITPEVLMQSDRSGLQLLRDRIKEHVFPQMDEEVKALYTEGHKVGGVLARQRTEPVRNYISRRER